MTVFGKSILIAQGCKNSIETSNISFWNFFSQVEAYINEESKSRACGVMLGYAILLVMINRNNIGKIRRFLFVPWDSWWNAFIRDITARFERNN